MEAPIESKVRKEDVCLDVDAGKFPHSHTVWKSAEKYIILVALSIYESKKPVSIDTVKELYNKNHTGYITDEMCKTVKKLLFAKLYDMETDSFYLINRKIADDKKFKEIMNIVSIIIELSRQY